jgi:hypothetical protein
VSPLVGFWWATYLIGGFVGGALLRATWPEPEDYSEWIVQDQMSISVGALTLVGAVLAIALVRSVTGRQEDKAIRLAA